jgi:hypothetical protein
MFRNLAIVNYAAVLVLLTATSIPAAECGTPERRLLEQLS